MRSHIRPSSPAPWTSRLSKYHPLQKSENSFPGLNWERTSIRDLSRNLEEKVVGDIARFSHGVGGGRASRMGRRHGKAQRGSRGRTSDEAGEVGEGELERGAPPMWNELVQATALDGLLLARERTA